MPSSATPADEADPSGSDVGSLGLLRSDQPTISWSFSRLFRLRLELEAGRRPGLVGTGGVAVEVPSKPGHRHPPRRRSSLARDRSSCSALELGAPTEARHAGTALRSFITSEAPRRIDLTTGRAWIVAYAFTSYLVKEV
jgi:hypothetical protein